MGYANVTNTKIASFCFYFNNSLNDCNGTGTHNQLVRKRTLNHLVSLAKCLSVRLRTNWLWVRVPLQSLKLQLSHLFRAKSTLTF